MTSTLRAAPPPRRPRLSWASTLVVVRHRARLDLPEEARLKLRAIPEFLLALAIDHRGPALLDRHLIRALERRAEFRRLRDVFAVTAERFRYSVVAQVFLKQVDRQRIRFALCRRPRAPRVVVVDDHDDRELVLAHRVD